MYEDTVPSPVHTADDLTNDCHAKYYWNDNLECEDPNITLLAKRKSMEKYEFDLGMHSENKKAIDLLKTTKSRYDIESFMEQYSNALETVRNFFKLYSQTMSTEEKQWGRNEVEYMRGLRQAVHTKIFRFTTNTKRESTRG